MDRHDAVREIQSWSDGETGRIESRIGDAAVEIVYQAELEYRMGAARRYEWRKGRKAELEEEARQRLLEAERAEQERIAKLEKERVDRLLRDAAAFNQAATIRNYVETVRVVMVNSPEIPPEKIEAWSRWAVEQADRIDPALNRSFLGTIDEA
jgi:regulator of protease activity HflC (stomatin/prohibitin superfamily)